MGCEGKESVKVLGGTDGTLKAGTLRGVCLRDYLQRCEEGTGKSQDNFVLEGPVIVMGEERGWVEWRVREWDSHPQA